MGSGCSPTLTDAGDAKYFCEALYGSQYDVLSYKSGKYGKDAGKMGWKIYRGNHIGNCIGGCGQCGYDIPGTDCSGKPCKIVQDDGQYSGFYDLICSGKYNSI